MKLFNLTNIAAITLAVGLIATGCTSAAPTADNAASEQSADTTEVETAEIQTTEANPFVTVEQDHPTTGTASVVTENGQRYLEFDAAFTTATGPDVTVVLHNAPEVPVNLDEADYVTIADLESFEGAQRYLIPADVDLADYESVGIWCREFNVTFGYAPL